MFCFDASVITNSFIEDEKFHEFSKMLQYSYKILHYAEKYKMRIVKIYVFPRLSKLFNMQVFNTKTKEDYTKEEY
ncbi:MAG: hypothetical protein MSIBF_06985 [Candidatus Altiarchaeales archaeon IMC4]|nr:MAG: hypothetical protein MSIBF_06985 [Candidatus Altiarchaeales archaeon IMC4]